MESSVKQRLKILADRYKISVRQLESKCGFSNGYINSISKSIGGDKLEAIIREFPNTDRNWILTGEGNMIKPVDDAPEANYKIGVPYYNVDFIGGFDLITNDQTINPDYLINFKKYNEADYWCNIAGHSMEPEITNGDIIAIKEIRDWQTFLTFGDTYAIVTNELRTVKKIRKGTDDAHFLLVPNNTVNFDPQEIPKAIILRIFKVLGCMKKL